MTQNEMVLEYMREHKGITPMEAIELFGITRLSGRIFELKKQGISIRRVDCEGLNRFGKKTRYARYELRE